MNGLELIKPLLDIDYGALLRGILIGAIACVVLILIIRIVRGRITH
jgi:hypothetical protein